MLALQQSPGNGKGACMGDSRHHSKFSVIGASADDRMIIMTQKYENPITDQINGTNLRRKMT